MHYDIQPGDVLECRVSVSLPPPFSLLFITHIQLPKACLACNVCSRQIAIEHDTIIYDNYLHVYINTIDAYMYMYIASDRL